MMVSNCGSVCSVEFLHLFIYEVAQQIQVTFWICSPEITLSQQQASHTLIRLLVNAMTYWNDQNLCGNEWHRQQPGELLWDQNSDFKLFSFIERFYVKNSGGQNQTYLWFWTSRWTCEAVAVGVQHCFYLVLRYEKLFLQVFILLGDSSYLHQNPWGSWLCLALHW